MLEQRQDLPRTDRCLGLALGGGGGRGGAHLGVLDALAQLELPIDMIVGTSIGGVVGVMFAAGYRPGEIAEILDGRSLWDVVERDPRGRGLLGNHRLRAIFERALGERTFADLQITCTVIATDLVRGRQVIIDHGSLVEALLATTALPGLFPPVEHEGMLLADGGIVNNLPVDIALARGAHRVVAVDLDAGGGDFALAEYRGFGHYWRGPHTQLPLEIAHRALTILIAQVTRQRLAGTPPDVLLRPAVAAIGTLDMNHIAETQAAGMAAVEAARSELLTLRTWRSAGQPLAHPDHAPNESVVTSTP